MCWCSRPTPWRDAPHNLAATIDLPPGANEHRAAAARAGARLPVQLGDRGWRLLRQARELLGTRCQRGDPGGGLGRGAGGLAVLLGAIAAARASRSTTM
jgi:putative ABC transport system permease protein